MAWCSMAGRQDRAMTIGDMFGGTTMHRLVQRGGREHRDAVFPTGSQATIALGDISAVTAEVKLSFPAFELTNYIDELVDDGQTFRATVVANVMNDPSRVEIVEGLIMGVVDQSDGDEYDIGQTGVKFDDGTFVYMYDILSLRVEL